MFQTFSARKSRSIASEIAVRNSRLSQGALSVLFAPHGFSVEVEEHILSLTDTSPAAYLDGESRDHPMAVAGLAVLEGLGQADLLRDRLLQILVAGNEDPAGFRTTSRYVIATARRETG